MRKLSIGLVALLLILLALPLTTSAQEGRIDYGQTVSGEITDAAFEIPYTFKGTEGDFIHVRMAAVDSIDGPEAGIILIEAASGTTLAAVDGFFKDTDLFFPLPATGEYTILATRREGRSGTTVGAFNLTLDLLPVIEANFTETVTLEVSTGAHYYVVNATQPVRVSVTNGSGDLDTYVGFNYITFEEEPGYPVGSLILTATAGGFAEEASLRMGPSSDGFYVLSVDGPNFWYSGDTRTRTFDLAVTFE